MQFGKANMSVITLNMLKQRVEHFIIKLNGTLVIIWLKYMVGQKRTEEKDMFS